MTLGTEESGTLDIARYLDVAEVSLVSMADELITSTIPRANNLLPVGKDGKPSISC